MKRGLIFSFLIITAILVFTSCKSDGDEKINEAVLEKDWEVVGAIRNGKKTETMNGAYFRFQGNKLTSNYLMEEISEPYKFNSSDNTIDLGEVEKVFKVHYMLEDSMHLSTKVRNIPFHFFLN